jgi:hypothetical protein
MVTFTGATAAVFVIGNTAQSVFQFNPRWFSLVVAEAISGESVEPLSSRSAKYQARQCYWARLIATRAWWRLVCCELPSLASPWPEESTEGKAVAPKPRAVGAPQNSENSKANRTRFGYSSRTGRETRKAASSTWKYSIAA